MAFTETKYKIESFEDAINAMKYAQKLISDSTKYLQKADPEALRCQRIALIKKPEVIQIKWYIDICERIFTAFLEGQRSYDDELFSGRCAFNEFFMVNENQYGFKNKLTVDSKIADNLYDKLIEDPFNGKDPLEEYPGLYICIKDDTVYMHYTNESRNPHIVDSVRIDMTYMKNALKNAYDLDYRYKRDKRKSDTIVRCIEDYLQWYRINQ